MSPYLTNVLTHDQDVQGDGVKDVFPHIEDDPQTLPSSLDPFTITTSTGFLPLRTPQVDLPSKFKPLTTLADNLPVVKLDGSPGLLATYKVGSIIDHDHALPDLNDDIGTLIAADGRPDLAAVTAVFRDYAFIASSYLLEPCWERWNKGLEGYGLGRQVLPKCIASPLVKTAKMYTIPFMLTKQYNRYMLTASGLTFIHSCHMQQHILCTIIDSWIKQSVPLSITI